MGVPNSQHSSLGFITTLWSTKCTAGFEKEQWLKHLFQTAQNKQKFKKVFITLQHKTLNNGLENLVNRGMKHTSDISHA